MLRRKPKRLSSRLTRTQKTREPARNKSQIDQRVLAGFLLPRPVVFDMTTWGMPDQLCLLQTCQARPGRADMIVKHGGEARARTLTAEQRKAIATKASKAAAAARKR